MSRQDDKIEQQFWSKIRKGGGRASLEAGHVIYQPTGGESVRVTYLDRTNDVRPLISNRLKVPDHLRAVGNFYGDAVLISTYGPGKPFAQEALDGGVRSEGVSFLMVQGAQCARIAQECMARLPALTHRCNTKAARGPHDPIAVRALVDGVCVRSQGIAEIALRAGWWVQGKRHAVVHDKQASKLRNGLIAALEAIDEVWIGHGIDARRIVGIAEVR